MGYGIVPQCTLIMGAPHLTANRSESEFPHHALPCRECMVRLVGGYACSKGVQGEEFPYSCLGSIQELFKRMCPKTVFLHFCMKSYMYTNVINSLLLDVHSWSAAMFLR